MWEPIRVCLVGDSGAGKSTAAWILGHRLAPCVRVDVARPLHEACDYIYREAGLIPPSLRGVQDGRMLHGLREIFQTLEPEFLEQRFRSTVYAVDPSHSMINADCRLALMPAMQQLGFTLVHINRDSAAERQDITRSAPRSPHDLTIPQSACDFSLENSGTLAQLEQTLVALIGEIRGTH